MADEYVKRYDAETAIAEIYSPYGEDGSGDAISREVAMSKIRHIPAADVVEVVRCKDCIYKDTCEDLCSHDENWFCGDGKRRADNG